MSLVTITEASRLVSKSTQTLYRHIKSGKLSRRSDKLIDTAELLRVYDSVTTSNATSDAPVLRHENVNVTPDTSQTEHVKWLESQIDDLKTEVKEIRQEGIDRENRLMLLLENDKKKWWQR